MDSGDFKYSFIFDDQIFSKNLGQGQVELIIVLAV